MALRNSGVDLTAAICATADSGVDVLAADRNFDGQIRSSDPRCLARALDSLVPIYDVILLDSPPSAANLIVCALLASEGVIVPTALDYLALDGVRQFARSYHQVMTKLQAALLGLAIVPMRVDFRTNMQKIVLEKLLAGFGSEQVMCGIRTDVSAAEAFGARKPLRRYRMDSRAVGDFRVMADEVTRRFRLA
jgi:chromosome partitioning protein